MSFKRAPVMGRFDQNGNLVGFEDFAGQLADGAGGFEGNWPAAVVGAVGVTSPRGRKSVMRFGRAVDATGVASTTARTTQQAWRFPFDVYGFRFGVQNNNSQSAYNSTGPVISLHKAAIIGNASQTLTAALDGVSAVHLATPFDITWNGGSAGRTLAARIGADDPSLAWSDWTYKKVAAGELLVSRMLWPLADNTAISPTTWYYPYSGTGLSYTALLAADPDIATMHWHDTSDRVTGWTRWGVTTANGTGNLSIPFIELLTSQRVVTVGVIGDSTTTGQVDSGDAPLAPVWAACEAASTSAVRFTPICHGWGGKEAHEYYEYALDMIANYPPQVLFYQVWSQNDTGPTDNTRDFALAMDIVSRCRAAGIVPVLLTGIPVNAWTTPTYDTSETARTAINALVRASGEIVCDMDAVLSDGTSPANYLSAYGSTVHPNTAGYAAMVTEYARALRQAAVV